MTLNYQKDNRYEREVYCPNCHIYSNQSDDGPKCWNCKAWLIRVVYSILTGKRLTGEIKKEDEDAREIEDNSLSTRID